MKFTAEFRENPPPRSPARSTSSSTTIACRSSGGSRPDRLVDVRPQERVPRRIVEQIVDTVPVVQLLHVPVPQMVDSVVEVLQEPQLAEQLVEVPPIVPQLVGFFACSDGYVWRQLSGPTGAYWWRVGSSHTQWAPPHRGTPPGQGGIEILARADRGRPR